MKKSDLTKNQYTLLTVFFLFVFSPVGIAMLCSKRIHLALITKIFIIIADLIYFLMVLMYIVYSPRPSNRLSVYDVRTNFSIVNCLNEFNCSELETNFFK